MNKAFVREADSTEIYCPLCGAVGEIVPESAVANYVSAELRQRLGAMVYFCETPTCEAVYFDAVEDHIATRELLRPVYPKDPAAPLCACFGFTRDEIEQDIAAGSPQRIRALVAKSKTTAAHCGDAAANGRSCLAAVQKYYFRRLPRN